MRRIRWDKEQLLVNDMRWINYWKRGSAHISTVYVILIICFIGAMGLEYYRINGVLRTLERHMQSTMLSHVTTNYQEVFSGTKKKSAAAYSFNEDSDEFFFYFDEGRIMDDLADDLHLNKVGSAYVSSVGEYTLSNLDIEVTSAPAEVDSIGVFVSDAVVDVEIPFRSVLRILPSYKAKLAIQARYVKKY